VARLLTAAVPGAGQPRASRAISTERPEGSEKSAPNRTVLQQHMDFFDRWVWLEVVCQQSPNVADLVHIYIGCEIPGAQLQQHMDFLDRSAWLEVACTVTKCARPSTWMRHCGCGIPGEQLQQHMDFFDRSEWMVVLCTVTKCA
jgi:hypothetical protein